MISFSLICDKDHEFEAWFRSSADFEAQLDRKLVQCAHCGTSKVSKALMAPAVSTGKRKERIALAAGEEQRAALAKLKEMAEQVRKNADYVGDRFADEARKIHFGETDPRGIYGEATPEEAKALIEDGVAFAPLPVFPEDHN